MSASEMRRARRHLETTRKMKDMLPRFFMRTLERRFSNEPLAWCMVGVPPELLKAFDPVSYTHLDVYKRQSCFNLAINSWINCGIFSSLIAS